MSIVLAVVPWVYLAYMWFVWRTSRVERVGVDPHVLRRLYGRVVVALWHDEVFFVAWGFRHDRAATLASRGDFGSLIARILELCNFRVFRGGSSAGRSRRAYDVLEEMIEHMQREPQVLYGITVDGSNGPRYRLKKGVARIAVACRAPVVVEKTWCRRYVRLPTWDRTIVPLPFNRVIQVLAGPYLPPPDADTPRGFVRFCRTLQQALLEVTWEARSRMGDTASADALEDYPPGWKPPAAPMVLERPFGPIEVASGGQTGRG
jgi:hypothetical protein